jgi:glycosyltransferase involved in cell wall biosynthesis
MINTVQNLVIYNSTYPDPQSNDIGDEFVRIRAEEYCKNGFKVNVIGFSDKYRKYNYNGIEVEKFANKQEILSYLANSDSKLLLIHFIPGWLARKLISLNDKKVIVWIHGWESLGWYRRLYVLNISNVFKYILSNIIQLLSLRYLIYQSNKMKVNCEFVFVSNWMKKICETDCLIKVDRYKIIPNPIDHKFFELEEKSKNFKNILLIRSFANRKYATDLAVKFIQKIKEGQNNNIKVLIVGKGKYFSNDTKLIQNLDNVEIHEKFLSKQEIKKYHKEFGFFLCPTRQDAQGVSMCEAMASGLIPITNYSTAIPEFVSNGKSGIMENSIDLQVEEYNRITKSFDIWEQYSQNVRNEIISKAGIDTVIENEIKLFDAKTY